MSFIRFFLLEIFMQISTFFHLPSVLKVKLYAANFPCTEPYGHVCKYALSIHEDDYSLHLESREHASLFIVRKPGLDGNLDSLSFELDDHRGYYLRRDGVKFVAQKGVAGAAGTSSHFMHEV